ncbi:MAG: DedA family protein [bacterium]|nr:DedA family protein [bacterium]
MSELLAQIIEFAKRIVETGSYPGIVFVMALENVFPPIPSEVVMPLAGFLVADGKLNFIGIWIAGTLGSVIGALILYYIGLLVGEPVMRTFIRRYGKWFTISEQEFDRALDFFGKYGGGVIFFGRLIPIIRSLISIPAGMDRMPLPKFLLYTTLGTAIWSGALGFAGLQLGENWEQVEGVIERYQDVVIVVLVLLVVAFVAWRFTIWRSRRNQTAATPGEAA